MRATPSARLLLAALILAPAMGATAQPWPETGVTADPPPARRLRLLERRIEDLQARERLLVQDRAALLRELAGLQDELVAAAARLRDIEFRLPMQAARRDILEAQVAAAAAGLEARRTRLARVVLALERAGRVPPEAMLLRERSPLDAARASRLLAQALPALDAEAGALRAEIAALDVARAALEAEDTALAASRAELAAGRERLETMIGRRSRLVAAMDTERVALALRSGWMGREADALRELMDRMAARLRADAEARMANRSAEEVEAAIARPFAEARGRAHPPVDGPMISSWGDAEGNGRIRRGLTFVAAPYATVVAPWHGVVAYAGPFRGYGSILIVESGDGYHWFIAGFDRLDVAQGQKVLAGEPLGRAGAAGNPGPTIYVELRRNGQPVDPGPWIAAVNGRMSG